MSKYSDALCNRYPTVGHLRKHTEALKKAGEAPKSLRPVNVTKKEVRKTVRAVNSVFVPVRKK